MKLLNGYNIPNIGFGTYKIPNGDETYNAVTKAINIGYRLIDTAYFYGNENSVGRAVLNSGIDRKELFVTSKLWNTDRGYNNTLNAFEKTMNNLGLDYLDLYLVHWPANSLQYENWNEINMDTWQAMIDIYKKGRVKSIGVCNFLEHHLVSLLDMDAKPMVNQIEVHIGQYPKDLIKYCNENKIIVEAWAPLGRGKLFKDDNIVKLSQKYNVTPAQLCIKWCILNNMIPLPKSVDEKRILENIDVNKFTISQEDMKILNNAKYITGSGHNPDTVIF